MLSTNGWSSTTAPPAPGCRPRTSPPTIRRRALRGLPRAAGRHPTRRHRRAAPPTSRSAATSSRPTRSAHCRPPRPSTRSPSGPRVPSEANARIAREVADGFSDARPALGWVAGLDGPRHQVAVARPGGLRRAAFDGFEVSSPRGLLSAYFHSGIAQHLPSSPRTRSGVHDFGAAMDPGSSPG